MGHTEGAHPLPFGHNAKAADDIDGLAVSCHAQKSTHLLSTLPH